MPTRIREDMFGRVGRHFTDALDAAARRGELRPGVQAHAGQLMARIAGSLFFRRSMLGERLGHDVVAGKVDSALAPWLPDAGRRGGGDGSDDDGGPDPAGRPAATAAPARTPQSRGRVTARGPPTAREVRSRPGVEGTLKGGLVHRRTLGSPYAWRRSGAPAGAEGPRPPGYGPHHACRAAGVTRNRPRAHPGVRGRVADVLRVRRVLVEVGVEHRVQLLVPLLEA
ncbi:hypothetical protein ABZZ74_06710 [Streptomyces sp. NPDC006476]|uniref:hypothetical protein n=1 Tax=Streptomyces sp. NPDC006476 TaxID=3157175 RepID=UPI0033B38C3D